MQSIAYYYNLGKKPQYLGLFAALAMIVFVNVVRF